MAFRFANLFWEGKTELRQSVETNSWQMEFDTDISLYHRSTIPFLFIPNLFGNMNNAQIPCHR